MCAQGAQVQTLTIVVSRAYVLQHGTILVSEGRNTTDRNRRSKSERALAPGLYLVATPIGNAGDITLRGLDVLKNADAVYAEDTRVTAKLLAIHGLNRPLHSYREHNAREAEREILRRVQDGAAVALVSDAGTPLVSDPGESLVAKVSSEGLAVYPIPGASAALAALTVSGLATDRFMFAGFLPARGAERRRAIRELESVASTLILFEGPSRLAETLADLAALLGERPAAVARELTKLHEEVRRGTLTDLSAHYAKADVKGEIVIVIAAPNEQAKPASATSVDDRLREELARHPIKDAAAIVAAELGLPRREIYARALQLKQSGADK